MISGREKKQETYNHHITVSIVNYAIQTSQLVGPDERRREGLYFATRTICPHSHRPLFKMKICLGVDFSPSLKFSS